ncbi:NAD(P)-binding protein [Apiospora saccharicola]|uniref:NAD(P)-binding protein n=1 Tax=Apiospora saccharicola TaxID=335842 RepID=A0ABR1WH73_9PEZI
MDTKVAIVTGGASGMGLAVAQALTNRGGWRVHVLDVKTATSQPSPDGIIYHQADTTDYGQLTAVFKSVWTSGDERRLDFVFANAGILDSANFFGKSEAQGTNEPPPEPDYKAVDVNLRGCVNTIHLAHHYMVQSPDRSSRAIAVTASQSAIWPTCCLPLYTASKHGVLGFVRSVADWYFQSEGIRINTLCPSSVKTDLLPDEVWAAFDPSSLTSMDLVVKIVLEHFLDGKPIVDSNGRRGTSNYGQTVVPSGEELYLEDLPPFVNAGSEALIRATAVDQKLNII